MPRFLFFRHAQSQNNEIRKALDKEWEGSVPHIRPLEARKRKPDPDLTELGLKQAQNLGEILPQYCRGRTLIACSPFLRTLRTLEYCNFREDVDVLCHDYLSWGCYHMKQTYPGMKPKKYPNGFKSRFVDEHGWFHGHSARESKKSIPIVCRELCDGFVH